MHEAIHVMGFTHEFNRYDRNKYVTIFYKNVKPSKQENVKFNFLGC